jgi:hypothetical protein
VQEIACALPSQIRAVSFVANLIQYCGMSFGIKLFGRGIGKKLLGGTWSAVVAFRVPQYVHDVSISQKTLSVSFSIIYRGDERFKCA